MKRLLAGVRLVGLNILMFSLLIVALQIGAALVWTKPVAESEYVQHDSELGWVSKPNVRIPDLYGPGVSFSTDENGFRRGVTPVGRSAAVRLVCSGDSFTLGYGVSDENTWCARLDTLESSLETINMGQGGYGLDQAYLWYLRNGAGLRHDVHVVSFITVDFDRMMTASFNGFAKPTLAVRDGRLVTLNAPVPHRPFYVPWLVRSDQLFGWSKAWNRLWPTAAAATTAEPTSEIGDVVGAIFKDLAARHAVRGSTLVLAYLPTRGGENRSASWREFIRKRAAQEQIHFLDLTKAFEGPTDQNEFYIPPGVIRFQGSAGHYTDAGNNRIAEAMLAGLAAIPEFRNKVVACVDANVASSTATGCVVPPAP
jgi:hypothetical protein